MAVMINIIQQFIAWDISLFRFVNDGLYARILADLTYFLARDQLLLTVLILSGIGYAIYAGWRRAAAVAGWGAIAVVCSNLLHNHWLKLFFNRQRPFLSLPEVHLCASLNDLSNVSLSFPSTHAASAAALACIAGGMDKTLRWPAVVFAVLIGWGTIYSGGHYPADVLAGYVIGVVLGLVVLRLSRVSWPGNPAELERTKTGDGM